MTKNFNCADDALECVVIEGSRVVCSTMLGDEVLQKRIFNFTSDNQPVTQALLTTFSSSSSAQSSPSLPFSSLSACHTPDLSPSQSSADSPQKALVVVLKTLMYIIYLEGGSYIIHLPFPLIKIWSIPLGLLLERQIDPIPHTMLSQSEPQLPRLFTLSSPLEDFGMVTCNRFPMDSKEKIVFVSSQKDALCVTRNVSENRITIWHASPDQQARRKVLLRKHY
jgi:Anaphase-promoting complex subunit 1